MIVAGNIDFNTSVSAETTHVEFANKLFCFRANAASPIRYQCGLDYFISTDSSADDYEDGGSSDDNGDGKRTSSAGLEKSERTTAVYETQSKVTVLTSQGFRNQTLFKQAFQPAMKPLWDGEDVTIALHGDGKLYSFLFADEDKLDIPDIPMDRSIMPEDGNSSKDKNLYGIIHLIVEYLSKEAAERLMPDVFTVSIGALAVAIGEHETPPGVCLTIPTNDGGPVALASISNNNSNAEDTASPSAAATNNVPVHDLCTGNFASRPYLLMGTSLDKEKAERDLIKPAMQCGALTAPVAGHNFRSTGGGFASGGGDVPNLSPSASSASGRAHMTEYPKGSTNICIRKARCSFLQTVPPEAVPVSSSSQPPVNAGAVGSNLTTGSGTSASSNAFSSNKTQSRLAAGGPSSVRDMTSGGGGGGSYYGGQGTNVLSPRGMKKRTERPQTRKPTQAEALSLIYTQNHESFTNVVLKEYKKIMEEGSKGHSDCVTWHLCLTFHIVQQCTIAPTKVSTLRFHFFDYPNMECGQNRFFADLVGAAARHTAGISQVHRIPKVISPAQRLFLANVIHNSGARNTLLLESFRPGSTRAAVDVISKAKGTVVETIIDQASKDIAQIASSFLGDKKVWETEIEHLHEEIGQLAETMKTTNETIYFWKMELSGEPLQLPGSPAHKSKSMRNKETSGGEKGGNLIRTPAAAGTSFSHSATGGYGGGGTSSGMYVPGTDRNNVTAESDDGGEGADDYSDLSSLANNRDGGGAAMENVDEVLNLEEELDKYEAKSIKERLDIQRQIREAEASWREESSNALRLRDKNDELKREIQHKKYSLEQASRQLEERHAHELRVVKAVAEALKVHLRKERSHLRRAYAHTISPNSLAVSQLFHTKSFASFSSSQMLDDRLTEDDGIPSISQDTKEAMLRSIRDSVLFKQDEVSNRVTEERMRVEQLEKEIAERKLQQIKVLEKYQGYCALLLELCLSAKRVGHCYSKETQLVAHIPRPLEVVDKEKNPLLLPKFALVALEGAPSLFLPSDLNKSGLPVVPVERSLKVYEKQREEEHTSIKMSSPHKHNNTSPSSAVVIGRPNSATATGKAVGPSAVKVLSPILKDSSSSNHSRKMVSTSNTPPLRPPTVTAGVGRSAKLSPLLSPMRNTRTAVGDDSMNDSSQHFSMSRDEADAAVRAQEVAWGHDNAWEGKYFPPMQCTLKAIGTEYEKFPVCFVKYPAEVAERKPRRKVSSGSP